MATFDDLRSFALRLPGAYEDVHMGGPSFRVNNKKFALFWVKEQRTIMKLPPSHQVFLFEVRPETFMRCKVGTASWSYVELANLSKEELGELVTEAWSTVVPKRASWQLMSSTKTRRHQ